MSTGGTIYEGYLDADKLVEWIDENGPFKDWAILCYTNREVDKIMKLLNENFIPTINFNQKQKTKKELEDLVNADKVKVLTVWCAKGLGFPHVVVYGKNWLTARKNKEGVRVDYVAYTRAMDSLMVLK
jgi:DNA helicase IV